MRLTRGQKERLREFTRALVHARLAYFNAHYNFLYKKVFVRDTRSRWGSCSARGNLNFNLRLGLLPAELADYVIVHELCHLGQLNHSPAFWALVSQTFPEYKRLRKSLRLQHVSGPYKL